MPMFYFFRVFVQDASDYDADEDEWVSFDSAYVAADLGQGNPAIFQDKDEDRAARSEFQRIAMYTGFRAAVHYNVDLHTLRTLSLLKRRNVVVATDIELYKYDKEQGKNAAVLLSSMTFNSKVTDYFIDSSGDYEFRFQIVGAVGVGDSSDMSKLPGMAEKETQVGPSPRSAEEGRRLVAAFTGIKDAAGSVRTRFGVEAGLAALCGFLAILTLFTREWIEALTGFDPDSHNGSFEWTIVAALFLICILLSIAARADWRRLSASAPVGIRG